MNASEQVKTMYAAINRRDVKSAVACVAPDCVYQDLNFPKPFEGKAVIAQMFEDTLSRVPEDFKVVIDDIAGDDLAVGLTWHVELSGVPFPNTRGASFYRLSSESGLIVFGRDVVESPIKLGKAAFAIIKVVTPLARWWLNPSRDKNPISIILWLLVVLYVAILLLSPPGQLLPGEPIWAVKPETISEISKESLNFFFVLPILSFLAAPFVDIAAPVVHPASEAFFNFAEAWILMFLPLMLLDPRGQKLPRVALWSAAMFLTNVFLIPYMAQRLGQPARTEVPKKGRLARAFGLIGLIVGTGAIAWFCFARPEFSGLAERLGYFVGKVGSDRVTIAFCIDLILFWLFQIWLMSAIIVQENKQRFLRFVPFWGLAIWLIV